MENILIDENEATEDHVAKIKKEIEDLQNSGIPDVELTRNYQYMHNIAWMKLYNIMHSRLEEMINEEHKKQI